MVFCSRYLPHMNHPKMVEILLKQFFGISFWSVLKQSILIVAKNIEKKKVKKKKTQLFAYTAKSTYFPNRKKKKVKIFFYLPQIRKWMK